MIPEIGINILNEGIIVHTAQLGQKLIKAIDFNGRGRLISDLVRFYINLSDLNNNPKSKSLFQAKKAGQNFLTFVISILTKNDEAS